MEIKVLLAEPDAAQRHAMAESIQGMEGVRLVGAAAQGAEAIMMVEELRPHLLLCETKLPQLDGFSVMEYIARMPEEDRPEVIVLTDAARVDDVARALALGVAFYMVKPVEPPLLLHRIRQLCHGETPGHAPAMGDMVTGQLLQLGMPAHIHGYHFIRQAVMLVMDRPELLGGVTQLLYPEVARFFHTTPSRVERSIRHAISVTWARGGGAALGDMMARGGYDRHMKPTNCELIALLSERLRIRRTWL